MAAGDERVTRGRCVNRASAEPEVVFRIVHVAFDDGFSPTAGSPPPSYREQAVEVALGPNPTFQSGGGVALTRRVPSGQVVNAVPPSRGKPRPPRPPKRVGPPRIVETLRKAIEWHRQLDAGEVPNQAAIARREGVTHARVTQIMGLLRPAPEIQEPILSVSGGVHPTLTERTLRPIAHLKDAETQFVEFSVLLRTAVGRRCAGMPV